MRLVAAQQQRQGGQAKVAYDVRRLAGLSFAGMDVVEVSPPYDVAEITALAAATMAWDYIALLAPPARQ